MHTEKIYKFMLLCGLTGTMLLAVVPVKYAPETGFSDKINHIAAFLFLCMLALKVYPGMFLKTGLWLMLYGTIIEAVQIWVPGRSCSVLDLVADLCGTVAGVLLMKVYDFFREKRGVKIS